MNNARIIVEEVKSTPNKREVASRERVEKLTTTIEALQNVANSSYWKVLQQNIFMVDLNKAKRRLALESDTMEIFRLQGEIRWGEKFSLESLILKYQDELIAIRKNI